MLIFKICRFLCNITLLFYYYYYIRNSKFLKKYTLYDDGEFSEAVCIQDAQERALKSGHCCHGIAENLALLELCRAFMCLKMKRNV